MVTHRFDICSAHSDITANGKYANITPPNEAPAQAETPIPSPVPFQIERGEKKKKKILFGVGKRHNPRHFYQGEMLQCSGTQPCR